MSNEMNPLIEQSCHRDDRAPADSTKSTGSNASSPVSRGVLFAFSFCNFSVLWAYQSLISVQDYYEDEFPDANIDFWGIVAIGAGMMLGQGSQIIFGVNEKIGFDARILTGYAILCVVGIVVLCTMNAAVIILAFFVTGICNSLNESSLYTIAALFPSGQVTQAINIGNGFAGILNVTLDTFIRLFVDAIREPCNDDVSDALSMRIFIGIMILTELAAMCTYVWVIASPDCRRVLGASTNEKLMASQSIVMGNDDDDSSQEPQQWRQDNKGTPLAFEERMGRLYDVLTVIWRPLLVEFSVLFVSLVAWPGFPCEANLGHSWFGSHSSWWCSPFVIAAYNYGDFSGRCVAHHFLWLSTPVQMLLAVGRLLLLVPELIFVYVYAAPIPLLAIVLVIGFTNGVLCTTAMMAGPLLIEAPGYNREAAGSLMVLGLYAGITFGALCAAAVGA